MGKCKLSTGQLGKVEGKLLRLIFTYELKVIILNVVMLSVAAPFNYFIFNLADPVYHINRLSVSSLHSHLEKIEGQALRLHDALHHRHPGKSSGPWPGPILWPSFKNIRNKLECLSLARFSA